MIIPKRTVCDICGEDVGYRNKYYIVRSKDMVAASGGSITEHGKHHICNGCMQKFVEWYDWCAINKRGKND